MKTLKKTLCLVLTVVMVVGVLILPAYAADNYDAAIEALQNYGVLQGYPDGKLHEDANITRGQMAAIIYRIMTGDTTSTDAQVADKFGSYADRYTDANVAPWAKGYIGFCTNAGVLKGYDTGAIQPNKQINGYEVMAMLLRALGYDHNNEYTGNNWQYNVLSDAAKTGINKNVTVDPAKATPRGAVAQYTYDAATQTDRVAPTLYPNVGYASIGEKLMEIVSADNKVDDFGAPYIDYTVTYTWPDYDVTKKTSVVDKPLAEYWAPVAMATVAKDAGFKSDVELDTYTNGADNDGTVQIAVKDTVTTIGEQGRHTLVYADRIVYEDVFLSKVTSVKDAVVVNGIEVTPAEYTATAYYNNANGATAATSAYTASVDVTEGYAKDTWLAGYAVADNVPFTTNDEISELVDEYKVSTASVTVNAIVKSKEASDNEVGFIGTNGKTYLYNYTYAYNNASAITRLTDEDIGTTWTVILDANNNVLGLIPAPADKNSGVGVVTDYDVERLKLGEYVGVLKVLTEENKTVTVKIAGNTNKPWETEDAAATAVKAYMGDLVSWVYDTTAKTNGYAGYVTVTAANSSTPQSISGSDLNAGDADAIGTTAGQLLNDNTVFFIANYQLKNSLGSNAYVFTNYTVVKGFQNIQNLSYASGDDIKDNPNEDASGTALEVEYIAGTGSNSDWAAYVLVMSATEKSTIKKNEVLRYAYLPDPTKFVNVYDPYYAYGAIIDGKAGQTLRVDYNATSDVTKEGLYSYDEMKNNSWTELDLLDDTTHRIESGNYDYKAGVIWTAAGAATSATTFYTLANNASIYLVNPVTATSTKLDYTLDLVKQAYPTSTIWFQYDQYNWVNLVYVISTSVSPSIGSASEISTVSLESSLTAPTDLSAIADYTAQFTVAGTENYTVSSVQMQRMAKETGTAWVNCQASEAFNNTGYNYRVVVTFAAKSGYVFQNSISEVTNMDDETVVVATGGATLTATMAVTVS